MILPLWSEQQPGRNRALFPQWLEAGSTCFAKCPPESQPTLCKNQFHAVNFPAKTLLLHAQ